MYTSGAIRSWSRNGKLRSNILTLSPAVCLPVCLSKYMSTKCVANAEVTSTMVEEKSNKLYQSLRLFHTILSLASDTSLRGLSGPVWTTVKSRRTQNLSVEVHGRWKDILSIHSNEKLVKFLPWACSRQVQILCLEKCIVWTQFVFELFLLGLDLGQCRRVEEVCKLAYMRIYSIRYQYDISYYILMIYHTTRLY